MSSNVFMNNQLERIADYIDAGKAGGGSLTIDVTGFGDMQGATAGQAGVHGLVPAPAAGDQDKVLTGAGTWETPSGGGIPDYSNIIASGNYNMYDGFNYTATQNCFVIIMIGCSTPSSYPDITINNTNVGYLWGQTSGLESPIMLPLKAGDTLDISATNSGNNWSEKYTIFGM